MRMKHRQFELDREFSKTNQVDDDSCECGSNEFRNVYWWKNGTREDTTGEVECVGCENKYELV